MDKADLSDPHPQGLEEWAELLREEEMPIFSNTAQKIYFAMDDKKKGAMELASIILQDPSLTAKLLKVGNCPYYNPSRQKISTISRAIVILGMHMIRELTLACSFFESILSPANKDRANREIAQAIHAAVQAREFAITMRDQSPEEVFVAALLHNVGHVAFWCSSNRKTARMHEKLAMSGLEGEEAEKQVLGFYLKDLGKKLSKSWHLGGLIHEAISHPHSVDERVQTVCMGSEICLALKQGIDSEEMAACVRKIQHLGGGTLEGIKAKIKANTLMAVDIAQQFGAHDASQYISSERIQYVAVLHEDVQPDKKQIQFQVLQDITSHISGSIDLNVLFEMVLEGVYRGVEMDRTIFMLLGPDKKSLNEKISLGWNRSDVNEKIRVYNNEAKGNLLFHALYDHDGLWLKPNQHGTLYTHQIEAQFGRHECFVFPIHVEKKPIGLVYCDRGIGHKALTVEDFSAAKHFAKQAQIGLTLYRMKNH
ncbi:MAG: HDOD domain-containing protein [Methylomonas sp.]|jgi:HD-like signal output (HDOD) protein|uniref:HDOD domain-containing protein n=1 Tax=Methylomonas sp. TaxID=418 RepID=UPI0025F2AC38|nr:HDOD domain-containing protein [Methylomonas sp.]MCK9605311.1 HDOD domain-containing protein [Methylomonas sp.]